MASPRASRCGAMVGVDLVRVSEIERSLDRFGRRFLTRVFTEAEIAECLAGPARSAERLASRFAAKEAAMKALRSPEWLDWHSIEVRRQPGGWSDLVLTGRARACADTSGLGGFVLSMSHEGDYATAVVVALGSHH